MQELFFLHPSMISWSSTNSFPYSVFGNPGHNNIKMLLIWLLLYKVLKSSATCCCCCCCYFGHSPLCGFEFSFWGHHQSPTNKRTTRKVTHQLFGGGAWQSPSPLIDAARSSARPTLLLLLHLLHLVRYSRWMEDGIRTGTIVSREMRIRKK